MFFAADAHHLRWGEKESSPTVVRQSFHEPVRVPPLVEAAMSQAEKEVWKVTDAMVQLKMVVVMVIVQVPALALVLARARWVQERVV